MNIRDFLDDSEKRQLIAKIIMAGITGVGAYYFGDSTIATTLLSGIAVNVSSNVTEHLLGKFTQKWFTEDNKLNHDLRKGLADTFQQAVQQVLREWKASDVYHALVQHDEPAADRTVASLQLLKTECDDIFSPDVLGDTLIDNQTSLIAMVQQRDTATLATLHTNVMSNMLDVYLAGSPAHFRVFVDERLMNSWRLRFRETLKHNEQARTAYENVWQSSITETLAHIQQSTDHIQQRTDQTGQDVYEIKQLLERVLAQSRISVPPPPDNDDNDDGNRPTAPNPFRDKGRITDPDHFVGRERFLHLIFDDHLAQRSNISLVGERRIGRSSLLEMIRLHGPQRLALPPSAFLLIDMTIIYNEDDFYNALCDRMGISSRRGVELERSLRGKQYILCLDEIEALVDTTRFPVHVRGWLRGMSDGRDQPFTLIIASNQRLADLFPDSTGMLSPLANLCTHIRIPPFTEQECRTMLNQRLARTGFMFDEEDITRLIRESKGLPGILQQNAAERYDELRRD